MKEGRNSLNVEKTMDKRIDRRVYRERDLCTEDERTNRVRNEEGKDGKEKRAKGRVNEE